MCSGFRLELVLHLVDEGGDNTHWVISDLSQMADYTQPSAPGKWLHLVYIECCHIEDLLKLLCLLACDWLFIFGTFRPRRYSEITDLFTDKLVCFSRQPLNDHPVLAHDV